MVAGTWTRAVASVKAGWEAAAATWNEKALVPEESQGWDIYGLRLFRYAHMASYYHNTVYSTLVRYAAQHREASKLYKHIRSIYNPVTRLVDLYVAEVYGGSLDLRDLAEGAIPIETENDAIREGIRQLWQWSTWGTQKQLYVRWGAMLGDVPIKVVDDRQRGLVRLEVFHPGKIKDAMFDATGNVKQVTIEYQRIQRDDSGREVPYTYTETIDKEMFRTFKDGEPYAYFNDMTGQPVPEWPNEYGFVPMVIVQHKDVGMLWGASPFFSSLRKIDEMNDAASLLNDQIRKTVQPLWQAKRLRKGSSEIEASTSEKDKVPVVYVGDGELAALLADLNIDGVLNNIREMQGEIERDMPELSLHRLRESGSLTAPGVRAGYRDAIARIEEARGQYDDGLVRAQQMALSIGGYNGYDGFQGFSLESYERGDLQHTIAPRAVIEDELTTMERLTMLTQTGAPSRAVWEALNIPDKDIKDWEREQEAQQDAFNARMDQAGDDSAAGDARRPEDRARQNGREAAAD